MFCKQFQFVFFLWAINWQMPLRASLMAQLVRNLPANAGDTRDTCSVPGLGRSPGGGNDNLPQYSCLENSMNRGASRSMGSQRVRHDWPHRHTLLLTNFMVWIRKYGRASSNMLNKNSYFLTDDLVWSTILTRRQYPR